MTRTEALEIYKTRSEKFKNTQSLQWKTNFSIWTLFTLAIFYKGKMNFSFDYSILVGSLLTCVHLIYCYKLQKSLNLDKTINKSILDQLNKTNREDLNIKVVCSQKSEGAIWLWVAIQATVTLILAVVFAFISSCNNSENSKTTSDKDATTAQTEIPEYFNLRPKLEKDYGYSHAVRIGNDLKISGAVSMNDSGIIVAPGKHGTTNEELL